MQVFNYNIGTFKIEQEITLKMQPIKLAIPLKIYHNLLLTLFQFWKFCAHFRASSLNFSKHPQNVQF